MQSHAVGGRIAHAPRRTGPSAVPVPEFRRRTFRRTAVLHTRAGLVAFIASTTFAAGLSGQSDVSPFRIPTTNPAAEVHQLIAATSVEVSYHRPRVRGRVVFGSLVPWGKVWRTGSDNATRITFGTEVTLGGQEVAAGTYELFSVPGPDEWTIVLQEDHSQWGSYSYDAANDLVRVRARPLPLDHLVESFTISVDDVTNTSAFLNISWDRTRVSVPIEVDVRRTVVPRLEEALDTAGRKPYFLAAMFYYENDLDLDRAAELIELALGDNPGHIGMLHRQALILAEKGDIPGAIAAAEASLSGAAAAGPELKAEYTRLNNDLLARLRG